MIMIVITADLAYAEPMSKPPPASRAEPREPRAEPPERHHRYRAAVLEILAAHGQPITVQAIHAGLRARGLTTGLSTIYREVRSLVLNRRVDELQLAGQAGYRLRDGDPHDFVVCADCGHVEELTERMRVATRGRSAGYAFDADAPRVLHVHCAGAGPLDRSRCDARSTAQESPGMPR